jgi:Rrf2 family transcriptional regulator, iron-sulfur cluster assembly transcription factor
MKLSTRSRYGTRLMLDMAEHHQEGPIRLRTIANRQGIPVKYLEQIIIPLKKAGYVTSVRGYKGGHMLAKHPGEITVGEIVALMEGGRKLAFCTDNPERCERSGTCVTRWLWKEATEAMYERLSAVTLTDLVSMIQTPETGEVLGCIRNEEQG